MNEPPPPYSVCKEDDAWAVYAELHFPESRAYETHIECVLEDLDQALIMRDRLNAAYMQGWRDRDEMEQDDG